MRGLAYLLREHGEALEADFQRFYNLDLGDLWRGALTPRRASVLALRLPAGAQTWQSCGLSNGWTLEAHLAVSVLERLDVANWQRSKDGGEGKNPPQALPRPGDKSQDKGDTAVERAKAFRARQAAKEI